MKRKAFFFLSVLMAGSCIAGAEPIDSYFKRIVKSAARDYSLGRQICERQTFKVFPTQWIKTGTSEKYILQDPDANLYLFKNYITRYQTDMPNGIWSTKLSSLYGIPHSACYDIWLPVNKKLVYGTIQQILGKAENCCGQSVPPDKKWLAYYLFRWLIGDEHPQFLLTGKGELISIDAEDIVDNAVFDFESYDEGRFSHLVRLSLRQDSFDTAYREALGFINYAETLPRDVIAGFCGPYGYEERVEMFVLRKKRLRSEFENYCRRIAAEEGKVITVSGPVQDASSYARDVLDGLKESISAKESILKKFPDKQLARNFNIVASKIATKYGFSGLELRTVPISRTFVCARQKIEELKVLREESGDLYEALALSLYINQYEQFIPFYPYGILPLEEVRFIIPPETMDPGVIEANLCLGYSRNLKVSGVRGLERFQEYSLDEVGEFIEELSSREANAGWNYIMNGSFHLAYLNDSDVDLSLARRAYQKVLNLKQADTEAVYLAHMFLGYLYEFDGHWLRFGSGCDLYKAQNQFNLALGVSPHSIPARLNLLAIYLLQDDFKGAKFQVEKLAELDSYWKKKAEEINRLTTEDMQDLALVILDAESNYVMSLVYSIKGDYELAERYLNRAVSLGYDNSKVVVYGREFVTRKKK